MQRIRRYTIGLCTAATLACAVEAARGEREDHPLITRYPQSTVTSAETKDFAKYTLIVGKPADSMKFEGQPLEGKLTRIVYTNPADRSTLEIFRNYRQALEKAGAQILFSCEENACGPAYTRTAWNQFNGLFAASDGDPRYLAAKAVQGDSTAYVAVMVGKRRTQVDVVEITAMDTGLVAVDPAALAQSISETGSARIYGIYFDVDKADIQPQSKPALDAIAAMLTAQPSLSIFVVGHTDGTGTLAHNMSLSAARAKAVVTALTGQYKIAAQRLDPHGVGPLAPVAPNTTEQGRQQNRRVELVSRMNTNPATPPR